MNMTFDLRCFTFGLLGAMWARRDGPRGKLFGQQPLQPIDHVATEHVFNLVGVAIDVVRVDVSVIDEVRCTDNRKRQKNWAFSER